MHFVSPAPACSVPASQLSKMSNALAMTIGCGECKISKGRMQQIGLDWSTAHWVDWGGNFRQARPQFSACMWEHPPFPTPHAQV